MPEDLWGSAVVLARAHGVYRIAQALGLNYENLRRRVADSETAGGAGMTGSSSFIELDPRQWVPSRDSTGTVVELSAGDGAKLVIRVPVSGQVDLLGLANDFWSRRV